MTTPKHIIFEVTGVARFPLQGDYIEGTRRDVSGDGGIVHVSANWPQREQDIRPILRRLPDDEAARIIERAQRCEDSWTVAAHEAYKARIEAYDKINRSQIDRINALEAENAGLRKELTEAKSEYDDLMIRTCDGVKDEEINRLKGVIARQSEWITKYERCYKTWERDCEKEPSRLEIAAMLKAGCYQNLTDAQILKHADSLIAAAQNPAASRKETKDGD